MTDEAEIANECTSVSRANLGTIGALLTIGHMSPLNLETKQSVLPDTRSVSMKRPARSCLTHEYLDAGLKLRTNGILTTTGVLSASKIWAKERVDPIRRLPSEQADERRNGPDFSSVSQ